MTAADVGTAVRSAALLAVSGASVALFAQEVGRQWVAGFVRTNALSLANRHRLIVSLAAGAALGAGAAAVWLWRRRAGGLAALARAARFLAPLSLAGVAPAVWRADAWPDSFHAALAIAVFLLTLEPALRASLSALPEGAARACARLATAVPPRAARWAPAAIVAVAAAGYAAYMGYFTVLNHHRFATMSYDLGQYDNLFWNALHGHPFRCSPLVREGDWSSLRSHAEFSIYALLPFYALRPGAETLLIMQASILGAGSLFVYRFSARRLSRPLACVLALAYLLYPPLAGANFYDFHFQPIAAVFILAAIDCLDARRNVPFVIFFLLALGCREDISLGLAVLGVFLVITGHRPRAGAAIAAVAVAYFVVVKLIVMPRFGNWWFGDIYKELYPPGDHSLGGVIKTLLSNPAFVFRTLIAQEKLRYAIQILAPLAFLPLRRPALWLAVVPGAFFTFLTTFYGPTTDIAFQYSGHFIPYIFPAAALALAAPPPGMADPVRRRAAAGVLIAGTLLCGAHWGAIPPRDFARGGFSAVRFGPVTPAERQKRRDLIELAAMVPPDAPLAVSEHELPHVSTRRDCYSLRDGYHGADYLLYATDSGEFGARKAQEGLRAGLYVQAAMRPNLALMKRVR